MRDRTLSLWRGAVGEVDIHFAGLRVYGVKDSFGTSLVFVPEAGHVG